MFRIGHGYDVHRFAEGRALILGGVTVPHTKGLLGHSDADVLVHALCDALLGALALGDIGKHFPDTDPKYRGVSSLLLLCAVRDLIDAEGYRLANCDCTLLAQAPKLASYIDGMRQNIADVLGVDKKSVSVKATTEEGLGFTGREEGVAAHAVALLVKKGEADADQPMN